MTRAHRRPAPDRQDQDGPGRPDQAVRRRQLLHRPPVPGPGRAVHPERRDLPRIHGRAAHHREVRRTEAQGGGGRRRAGRDGSGPRGGRAWPRRDPVREEGAARRPDHHRRQGAATRPDRRHHPLVPAGAGAPGHRPAPGHRGRPRDHPRPAPGRGGAGQRRTSVPRAERTLGRRRRPGGEQLGRARRHGRARQERAGLRHHLRVQRHVGGGLPRRQGRPGGDRHRRHQAGRGHRRHHLPHLLPQHVSQK